MAANDKELLKEKIFQFLKEQKEFDQTQPIRVICDGGLYFVLYGADIQTGIAGFGETSAGAFNDFTDNWSLYNARRRM